MPVTRSELLELREAYRGAKATIEGFNDGLERDVGIASLRLEAVETYAYLHSTAGGLLDEDAQILKEYVVNLVGGESVEATVRWLDDQAKSLARAVLSGVTNVVSGGVVAGGIATVFGAVTAAAGYLTDAGAAFGAFVAVSGAAVAWMLRMAPAAWEAMQTAVSESVAWASGLGRPSDAALGEARRQAAEVRLRATGAPGRPSPPFTAKARLRVQVLVGLALALFGAGVLLVGLGFAEGFSSRSNPLVPSFTLSNPAFESPGLTSGP